MSFAHTTDLHPIAQHFVDSLPPTPLYTMSVDEARNTLEQLQTNVLGPLVLQTELAGAVDIHIVYPTWYVRDENHQHELPVILFFHGGGWILGSFHTHQRLVQELADRSGWAVVFVDYGPAPENKWPTQIE